MLQNKKRFIFKFIVYIFTVLTNKHKNTSILYQDVQKFLESLRRTPTHQPTFVEPDNNVQNINEQVKLLHTDCCILFE